MTATAGGADVDDLAERVVVAALRGREPVAGEQFGVGPELGHLA